MRTFYVTRLTIDNQSQQSGFTAHSQKILNYCQNNGKCLHILGSKIASEFVFRADQSAVSHKL